MLLFQAIPLEVDFFSYVNASFVPVNLHRCWPCEWKRFIRLWVVAYESLTTKEKSSWVIPIVSRSLTRAFHYKAWVTVQTRFHKGGRNYKRESDRKENLDCIWNLYYVMLISRINCKLLVCTMFSVKRAFNKWEALKKGVYRGVARIFSEVRTIGHFRVPKSFTFTMRLTAKPLLWKWVLFAS